MWFTQSGFQFKGMETLRAHGLTSENVPPIMGPGLHIIDEENNL